MALEYVYGGMDSWPQVKRWHYDRSMIPQVHTGGIKIGLWWHKYTKVALG